MKIVFLDIDGVLVVQHSAWDERAVWPRFHAPCVYRLNDITDKTGAKIVVSSSWRHGHNKVYDLPKLLRDEGAKADVVGMTGDDQAGRGMEIHTWLMEHDGEWDSFVILDDDGDMAPLERWHVRTNFDDGLRFPHVDRAVEILEGK